MVVTIIVAVVVILLVAEITAQENERRRSRWPGRDLGLIIAALPTMTFAGPASGQADIDRFYWFTECEPVLVAGEHLNLTPGLEDGSVSDRLPADIEKTVRFALRAYSLEADAHYKSWLPTPRIKVVVTTYPPDNTTPRDIDILFQKVVYDRVSDQYGYVTMGNAHGLSYTSDVRRVMRIFLDKYLSVNASACNGETNKKETNAGRWQPTPGRLKTPSHPSDASFSPASHRIEESGYKDQHLPPRFPIGRGHSVDRGVAGPGQSGSLVRWRIYPSDP